MDDPKTAVKVELARRGMNLKQFAAQLGVPQQSLSRTLNKSMLNNKSLWPQILEALDLKEGVEPK